MSERSAEKHQPKAHALGVEMTTPRDLASGGFLDLVAQCSCGSYDYVLSALEAAYWHGLHRAEPHRHGCYLLMRHPMPADWTPPVPSGCTLAPAAVELPGLVDCRVCSGLGHIERYGTAHRRFYNTGDRGPCDDCEGVGQVPWADPHEGFERLLATGLAGSPTPPASPEGVL